MLEGYADGGDRTEWVGDEALAAMVAMWGTGELQHVLNPDMPWNDEIRAALARQERLAASPRTVALMFPLVSELNVREILPTVRVPTLSDTGVGTHALLTRLVTGWDNEERVKVQ